MEYEEKRYNIYVIFNAQYDAKYYESFKAMMYHRQANGPYNFYDSFDYYRELNITPDESLKFKIQKNLERADLILVLLTKAMKKRSKFTLWQIEHAINAKKPIVAMNPNQLRSLDYDVCPTILKKHLALFIPYDPNIVELAIIHWPEAHASLVKSEKNRRKIFKYTEDTYRDVLGKNR